MQYGHCIVVDYDKLDHLMFEIIKYVYIITRVIATSRNLGVFWQCRHRTSVASTLANVGPDLNQRSSSYTDRDPLRTRCWSCAGLMPDQRRRRCPASNQHRASVSCWLGAVLPDCRGRVRLYLLTPLTLICSWRDLGPGLRRVYDSRSEVALFGWASTRNPGASPRHAAVICCRIPIHPQWFQVPPPPSFYKIMSCWLRGRSLIFFKGGPRDSQPTSTTSKESKFLWWHIFDWRYCHIASCLNYS